MIAIKFRAFQDNQMLVSPISSNYGLHRFFGLLYEDATVMQFTGLQDKNGVDIYENDIVNFTRNIGNYQVGKSVPYTTTHEVVWQEDISAFVLKDVGGYIKFRRLDGQYIYEVIGNVHQNQQTNSQS